jgi:hypothetical protein
MSKQLTLFGTRAVAKSFIVYRDPNGDYECFIERYCLRAKKTRGQINNQRKKSRKKSRNTWFCRGMKNHL